MTVCVYTYCLLLLISPKGCRKILSALAARGECGVLGGATTQLGRSPVDLVGSVYDFPTVGTPSLCLPGNFA